MDNKEKDISTDRIARAVVDAQRRTASGEHNIEGLQAEIEQSKGRSSTWALIGGVGAPLAIVLAGWAHGTLWGHEGRIVTLEAKRMLDDQTTQQTETRWEKSLTRIEEAMRRLEDKMDRKP